MSTDSDPRWQEVVEHFDRADALRRHAASHALRGSAYKERRRRLRAHSDAELTAAITLREKITGEPE